jgi:creatinine amidohydrolase/Fe(II)-dependent formamide hydrolase-like protein
MVRERNESMSGGRAAPRSGRAAGDPLGPLEVFDTLEVGPATIRKDRISVPYTIRRGGKKDTTEFVYAYEEDVFTPHDPLSCNLAAMMGAQLALNYGLFCSSIVFHGPFDDADRRFLRDMAQNTAREIFVKKFLEPNPFLRGEAAALEPVKLKNYCRAALEFPDEVVSPAAWSLHDSRKNRYAILSSGGKDSLLSFGLLDELGGEVHPVFVNESGRHWFTALNAYRHFKEQVQNTARVWTNSDRVFAWFLRRLPFIRQDFANVRSDEYPIRLWTVALFLFGALPLALKRGVGRVVIGDEYDTTERTSFAGITHYSGLFDQSRYFDNALSRYYMRKGWAMSQFSLLRPLSELLIEKILVSRYPDLQRHQVSCHATHADSGRMHPCGRCEKCRRIVGMLTALGADPRRCGYTDAQIQRCLSGIVGKGVHQESAGVEHLVLMLSEQGLIEISGERLAKLKAHPEVLQLRFDNRRSPVDGIPVDLREPLYRLYLEHTDGAVQRVKRDWAPFNVLNDPSMTLPYAFEPAHRAGRRVSGKEYPAMKHNYLWGELTWPEVENRLKKVDVALLPVGSIEQHGPHLPLDTDAFDAEYLARQIAEACSDPKPLVLPLVPYGVSYEHGEFKGTLGVSNDTLAHLIYEIGMCVARNGINKLVIINGHGGNIPAINYAAQMVTRDTKMFVCVDTGETSDVDIYKIAETPGDIHAGEIETSTSLAVRPHLVEMDKAAKRLPRFSSRYLSFSSKRKVSWYVHTKKISQSGVIGDPTKASAEKGEQMWEVMIAHLVALVEDLKSMTLDEIYHRRY